MRRPVLGRVAVGVAIAFAGGLASPGAAGAVPTETTAMVAPVTVDLPPARAAHALEDVVRAGSYWRLDTERGPVHVWTPPGYDAATAATIVFVHGYHVGVDDAWTQFRLPQQFALSGINAMFIAAEAPRGKTAPIVWPSLNALVATVAARLGVAMSTRRLVAVGHSGAYRTLAVWLASQALDTVVLLDAVYGELRFAPWVRASARRRLINIAFETTRSSDHLHRLLPGTKRVEGLPLDGLPEGRVVYATTDVGHWPLVTDGVALPLALRAIGVTALAEPWRPLGLPPRRVSDPRPERPVPILPPE